jgi:hypothetical protein
MQGIETQMSPTCRDFQGREVIKEDFGVVFLSRDGILLVDYLE